jgi:hypothetical protein
MSWEEGHWRPNTIGARERGSFQKLAGGIHRTRWSDQTKIREIDTYGMHMESSQGLMELVGS